MRRLLHPTPSACNFRSIALQPNGTGCWRWIGVASFITRLVGDSTAQAVVSTIVSLARAFKLGTVAEGVETVEQVKLLQSLGCEQSQGYLHSRPVPAEQFEALLSTNQNKPAVR
jgi:sensor c-di-GMP phosphodiesterase-like protein